MQIIHSQREDGMLKLAYMSFAVMLGTAPVFAQDLPPTAKKASMEAFKAFADGKKVHVEIFDMDTPVSGDLTWSWKTKKITGDAMVDGSKIPVSVKLSFKGDKACSNGKGEKPSCHAIFIDGNAFYEVRDDGKVHAKSTLVP
jgi:hypothetical protein